MAEANSHFDNHPSLTFLCDSSESSDASESSFKNSGASESEIIEEIQSSGKSMLIRYFIFYNFQKQAFVAR